MHNFKRRLNSLPPQYTMAATTTETNVSWVKQLVYHVMSHGPPHSCVEAFVLS